jgi:hypothetical protein
MSGEGELAFLKSHLGELSTAILRQLKCDILAEKKKREDEAATKAKWSGERPTGQPRGRQPGSVGDFCLPEGPRAAACKRKANELDSSDSSGSKEPATRLPAPGPLSGTGTAPLPAQAKGSTAQGSVVLHTASTGEQATSSGRKSSYAEVGAEYAGVVAGDRLKERLLAWITRQRSPLKKGDSREGKRGRDEKASRGTPNVSKSPEGRRT